MGKWERLKAKANAMWWGVDTAQIIGDGISGFMRANGFGKSWYEKHAEEFERTGNAIELERMLRHVKEE